MAFKIPFTNIIIGKQEVVPTTMASTPAKVRKDQPAPISSGRSSEPEVSSLLAFFERELSVVKPDFDVKLLDALEHLAKYNGDLSYALDNVVQLGATDHNIYFDESVSDEQSSEMIAYLNVESKKWYKGGMQTLINDLMAQVALTGAISAEIVPNNFLDGLSKVVLVNPKNIRFVYEEEEDEYMPYQVSHRIPVGSTETATMGMIELNPVTYKYYAIRRFNEKPYGIPPFLSALENIAIEKDMMDNFRSIVKRIGVFGFLNVAIRKPVPNPGETADDFQGRLSTYINSAVDQVEKTMNKGYVVGYIGESEFEVAGNPVNPQGAKELFDMNAQMKMSGLKQDPLMLGRNFNTSEAVGKVLITKLTAQISNIQRTNAAFIEDIYLIALRLAGYVLEDVAVEFDKPMLGDQLKEEQAYTAKIANNKALYQDGIISQQQYANNVGYDEADEEEPRPLPTVPVADPAKPAANGKNKAAESNSKEDESESEAVELYEEILSEGWPAFEYGHLHATGDAASFEKYFYGPYKASKFTELMAEYMNSYYNGTKAVYNKAIQKASVRIGNMLLKTDATASLQQITDKVMSSLLSNWSGDFSEPQKKVISKWVSAAYKAFRGDKSIFGDATEVKGKKIPASTFSVTDIRTMEYYKKSDSIYLGRFITDEDTKKKVTEFIKEKYIDGGLPIDNKKIITEFRKQFTDILAGEDWKIARIVNTSVSNMKDIAGLSYMEQAGVEQFERVEIIDNLTCGWCKNMNGRKFTVSLATDRFDQINQSDPLTIKAVKPFITSVYKKPEDMEKLSNAQLQAAGVEVGALHPGCRGSAIAVLD